MTGPGAAHIVATMPSLSARAARRALSPGASLIRLKPFSSFTGRVTELTLSRMYIWTTSSPATGPVFVTLTWTAVDSSRPITLFFRRSAPNSKVV